MCKLRAVCSFFKNSAHVMVSDYMWLAGSDAKAVSSSSRQPASQWRSSPFGSRPKRGTKLFITARCEYYAGGIKAKLGGVQRVEACEFVEKRKQKMYWTKACRGDQSPLWHGDLKAEAELFKLSHWSVPARVTTVHPR